jgi:hypothetical protein
VVDKATNTTKPPNNTPPPPNTEPTERESDVRSLFYRTDGSRGRARRVPTPRNEGAEQSTRPGLCGLGRADQWIGSRLRENTQCGVVASSSCFRVFVFALSPSPLPSPERMEREKSQGGLRRAMRFRERLCRPARFVPLSVFLFLGVGFAFRRLPWDMRWCGKGLAFNKAAFFCGPGERRVASAPLARTGIGTCTDPSRETQGTAGENSGQHKGQTEPPKRVVRGWEVFGKGPGGVGEPHDGRTACLRCARGDGHVGSRWESTLAEV